MASATQKREQLFGIHELYSPGPGAAIDIVAVHGLNGDALSTWTSDKSNICWLNDNNLLPKYLPSARVLTYGYNANLEEASDRPIIFLCHSLGGIIVKEALAYSKSRTASKIAHYHAIYTSTHGILFFGTPHTGARKAHLLANLSKLATITLPRKTLETNSSLVKALEEDSEVLQHITDAFAPLMSRFHVFFLWEQERTDLGYTKDYIVTESSAAPILDNCERAGIAADHRGMCKFEGRQEAGFRTVIAALRRYSEDAPALIATRTLRAREALKTQDWHDATELVRGDAPETLIVAQARNKRLDDSHPRALGLESATQNSIKPSIF